LATYLEDKVNVTSENIDELLSREGLVLIEFGATWCGPCKQMKPVVAAVAAEFPGGLSVGDVDIEQAPELAIKYAVTNIPQLRLFRNGQQIGQAVGSKNKGKLVEWIDECVQKAA
jgi:thioredoxin